MSDSTGIRIVVDNNNSISARIGEENGIKVISSVTTETTPQTLSSLEDVSITNNGPFLLYNELTEKWESSQVIDCGTF